MSTFNNRLTSRFNRTGPMYANDYLVTESIEILSKEKDVLDNASSIDKNKDINLSDISYLKTELPKRFGYTNNEKLMMANDLIFKALLNKSLKNGKLDLEDLEYLNVSLRRWADEYNKSLIRNFTDLVIKKNGKTIKRNESNEADKIKKLEVEIGKLEAENSVLTGEKDKFVQYRSKMEGERKLWEGERSKLEKGLKKLEERSNNASEIIHDKKLENEAKIAQLRKIFTIQTNTAS